MAQLRSVNTKFWEDPWVEELNVSEKLLFLYLITNSYANLAGVYEITIKRISFETGLNKETISNGLERFGKVRKAYFVNENYIILPNWLKNQNLNSNMKKGVEKIIQSLPNNVKANILGNDYQRVQKDYQSIRNTLLKYEVLEVEEEREDEEEYNENVTCFSFDEFWEKYPIKVGKVVCVKKYEGVSEIDRQKIKGTIDNFVNYKQFKDYIHPNPSTYLNQKRWEDVIGPVSSKPNNDNDYYKVGDINLLEYDTENNILKHGKDIILEMIKAGTLKKLTR